MQYFYFIWFVVEGSCLPQEGGKDLPRTAILDAVEDVDQTTSGGKLLKSVGHIILPKTIDSSFAYSKSSCHKCRKLPC